MRHYMTNSYRDGRPSREEWDAYGEDPLLGDHSDEEIQRMEKGYDEDSDDGEGGGPGSVGHHTRKYLRCFAFCFLVLFFLLMLYLPAYNQVQVREAPIFGWSLNTTRDLRVYVQPDNDTAVIPATNICSFPSGSNVGKTEKEGEEDSLLLLVIVCSSVANFEARQAIRETWALDAIAPAARVAFLLGNPAPTLDEEEEGTDTVTVSSLQTRVNEESRLHSDVIQEGFVDTYNNLTLKSVMLLKWASQHCSSARYIMKTDDDMFVNVGAIVAHLRERVRQRRKWQRRRRLVGTEAGQPRGPRVRVMAFEAEDTLLEGTLICGARPISSTRSKWYAPRYMFSGRVYPDYLSGTGYIMSRAVAKRLFLAALSTPLFHLEDVFVTGMCARASGLHPRDHPGFSYQRRRIDDPCGYRNTFTAHRLDAAELRLVWSRIRSPSLRCPVTSPAPVSPATGRPASIFAWSVNSTRDLHVYIQPDNDTSVIPATNICRFPSGSTEKKIEKECKDDGLLLLVIVCSSVANFESRQAIRETWALDAVSHAARVAFLLGNFVTLLDGDEEGTNAVSVSALQTRVNEENHLHSDIIQEGFVDTYNNLTLKSVMLLKWTLHHCCSAQYIMKTDDDMLVNVDAIVTHLRERVQRRRKKEQRQSLSSTEDRQSEVHVIPFELEDTLLEGKLICGAKPIPNTRSKWYAPKYMFSGSVYPDYLSGTGYIMSRSVVKRLYLAALSIPLFHLEDVFITGMCAMLSGIHPRDNPGFSYKRKSIDLSCDYNNTFTAHRLDAAQLRLVWSQIQSPSLQCAVASQTSSSPTRKCSGTLRRRMGFCH